MLFDEVRKAFDTAAEWLHTKKKFTADMLAEKPAQNLMQATNDVLQQAVSRGITHEVPEELTAALEQNTFIFSGFKTYHELREASTLLKDENGGFKPFERFLSDVQKINNTYNRNYLHAEYNHAVQSTQMAVKWHDFEQDGDRYLLQYRTAHDEKVRATHAALHNTTLPPDDPFWDEYYPPLGWNCRCTVVQVRRGKYPASDSSTSIANGRAATEKTPSFRFNPGKQRKCFPDTVSYIKHSGKNRQERDSAEFVCEELSMNQARIIAQQELDGKICKCLISNDWHDVILDKYVKHCVRGMRGNKKVFWIKNEILPKIQDYINNAQCIGRKLSDATHNTRASTVNLKLNTDYFFYFKIKLPNGEDAYLHLGRYKKGTADEGKLYLYNIAKNPPENMETI